MGEIPLNRNGVPLTGNAEGENIVYSFVKAKEIVNCNKGNNIMKKIWTDERKNILINNWKSYNDEELASMLNISIAAIQKERQRLGLHRKIKVIHNTKQYCWSEVYNLFTNRNYTLLSTEYVNYTTPLQYLCNDHLEYGIQSITLTDFLRGRGCMCCGKERTIKAKMHDDEYYITECNKRNFIYVGRYIKNQTTCIQYICNRHPDVGVQEKMISNFEKTYGCPFCHITTNENNLKDILINFGYKFTPQKRFNDCRDKNPLPFDFYLDDFNICIEFDGEFHYFPIRKGNMNDDEALEQLQKTQMHDNIKNKYCEDNNIPLIRIPYWEKDNMEYFLWDELEKYGAIIKNN